METQEKKDDNYMIEQKFEKDVKQEEQLQILEEQLNISQGTIISEQNNQQMTQNEKQADKDEEKINIITQIEERSQEINFKIQVKSLQNIRLQLESRSIYNYQFDSINNLQLIREDQINFSIYPQQLNQQNYICSSQHIMNHLQLKFKIENQSHLQYIMFRNKTSSYPIGNQINNENQIKIDKLKKVLHKCIKESKKFQVQGASYSIFKEFVFLLQKVSDLEYEKQQKQLHVQQQLKEIENQLKEQKKYKQKNDQMNKQISKILNEL
ncbi:unnamed protein product [Paramecium primaurelia]|uniref:Uncharacterized protein n=1 Tax=Paramecium primaurelia TaxID=5886 RepID=A0A8S1QM87_PARPR|nr:unnamed protein product [Paramecium primaurelia]